MTSAFSLQNSISLCPASFRIPRPNLPLAPLFFPSFPLCVCVQSCSLVSDFLWLYGLKSSRFLCPSNSPGRITGVGCHFFLQGITLTQGWNPRLQHWQVDSLPLSYLGSPFSVIYTSNTHGDKFRWHKRAYSSKESHSHLWSPVLSLPA